MKGFKILSILAVAGLLLVPATAMAKSHVSFSLNLFPSLPLFAPPRPVIVAPLPPPPPPIIVAQPRVIYVPVVPRYEKRTVVHHYYYPTSPLSEEGTPFHTYPPSPLKHR